MIEVGKAVTWTSQSGGIGKTKTGTVLAIVRAQTDADEYLPEDTKTTHIKYDRPVSIHDRVLVAVPAGKNNQLLHYYCPRRADLERQCN